MAKTGVLLACCALVACGSEDGVSVRGGSGAAGASSADVGDGAAGAQGFGNTSSVAPTGNQTSGAELDEDGAPVCETGMFCAPSMPDPDDCGSLTLEPDVEIIITPGNVLIVFDQSGSMGEDWAGTGGSKLQAATNALEQAFTPLQDLLTAGAIFFPTFACVPALPPPQGGAVTPIDGAGNITFRPGSDFLQAWTAKWGVAPASAGIGTPLQEAFDRADVALQDATLTGNTAVVLFTDGAPNCFPDPALTMTPTDLEVNRASAWLANGIQTYVVGLPGAGGVAVLDQIAGAGGTMTYIEPNNPAELEARLRMIAEQTVSRGFDSCLITLTPPADAPDKLHIVVDEAGLKQDVPRDLGNGAGWEITAAGDQIELMGALCDDAKDGRFDNITFEYGCVDLPALPPPKPPD